MAVGAGVTPGSAAARFRSERLQAKKGVAALLENKKVFYIAVFASLGGLLYGYEQGVLSQALAMTSFGNRFPEVHNSGKKGWMTSILQLGGWLGALLSSHFADRYSRKHAIFVSALSVILGSYLQAGARNSGYIYAGRWFTGT